MTNHVTISCRSKLSFQQCGQTGNSVKNCVFHVPCQICKTIGHTARFRPKITINKSALLQCQFYLLPQNIQI